MIVAENGRSIKTKTDENYIIDVIDILLNAGHVDACQCPASGGNKTVKCGKNL